MKKLIISALPILLAAGCYIMDETDLAELTAKVKSHKKNCQDGFTGENCGQCKKDFYGQFCEPCTCLHGTCLDGIYGTGQCQADSCTEGWQGADCDTCANDFYGPDCINDCSHGIIDTETGKCGSCNNGWDINNNCNDCASDYYGPNCVKINCKNGTIDEISGLCATCNPGWDISNNCSDCIPGFFGKDCQNQCNCNGHGTCSSGIDGTGCQCDNKWTGNNCDSCTDGYGAKCLEYGSVTDAGGITYKTVIINGTAWMAENSRYNDATVSCKTNGEDPDFYNKYGCLYTFYDAQKVCPKGWSLPTKEQFGYFIEHIKNYNIYSNITGVQYLISQSADWPEGSGGVDEFGFAALPAGYYNNYNNNKYEGLGSNSSFWSSSIVADIVNNAYAYYLDITATNNTPSVEIYSPDSACSVRCIYTGN